MSTVSVVIPVFNDARLLARCLDALQTGSRLPDEIVVVDNGSSDDSAAVAQARGARVVVEPRRGIAPASAAGFDAARGDLLARIDADCVPARDWLMRAEQRFDAHPGLDALTGSADFIDGSRFTAWVGRTAYLGWYFWAMGLMLGHPPFFGSNLVLRSTAWQRLRNGFHRESATVHDDLDLSFQVQPGMVVDYDDARLMEISARPFDSFGSFAVRAWRGVATLALNWPGWMRRRYLVARAAGGRRATAADSVSLR